MRRRDNINIPPEIMMLRDKTTQMRIANMHSITYSAANQQVNQPVSGNRQPIIRPKEGVQYMSPPVAQKNPVMSTADIKKLLSYNKTIHTQIYVSDRKHVTVNLVGGIGNRIFQMLAALAYSEKFNMTCIISKYHCKSGGQSHESNLIDMVSKIFPNINVLDNIQNPTIISEAVGFKYNPLNKSNTNVLLSGYFQNENYFPSSKLIPVLRTKQYLNTYFIHIRAGDYIGNSTFHVNLSIYYQNCINQLMPDTKYIAFSNDNEYATEYLKKFNIDYVLSDKTDQLEVFVEMANCEGGICANSSFSWMGAFFQNKTRGKRFMPSVWLNGSDCKGVHPKWATIVDVYKINEYIKPEIIKDETNNMYKYPIMDINEMQIYTNDCRIYDIFIKNSQIYLISTHISSKDKDVTVSINDIELSEFSKNEWEPMRYFVGPIPNSDTIIIKINNKICKTININSIEHCIPIENKHKLAFATLFKDDYYFVEKTVNHYRKQGVDCFYLYYNGANLPDGLPQAPDIIYKTWNIQPYTWNNSEWIHNAQTTFITSFRLKYFEDNEWIIMADIDELIINCEGDQITDILDMNTDDYIRTGNCWAKLSNNDILYSSEVIPRLSKCIYRGTYKKWPGIHYPKDISDNNISNCLKMLHVTDVLHPDRIKLMKEPFLTYSSRTNISVVYSIGIRCYTEIILKRLNLTRFSSIFGSTNMKNYNNIIECFNTNFDALLDETNLIHTRNIPTFTEENEIHGYRTLNKRFDNIEDYHDATIAHHDLSSEKDIQHFKRGIERLNYIKNKKIPILFVNISHYSDFDNMSKNKELVDSIIMNGFTNMRLISIYKNKISTAIKLLHMDKYNIIYTIPSLDYDNVKDDSTINNILSYHYNFSNLLNIENIHI